MARHTFKVSRNEDSAKAGHTHTVEVTIPSFDDATPQQRQLLWNEALRSVTIKAQGTLRRRLAAGVKPGAALNAEAQKAFDAILNGTRVVSSAVVIDVSEAPYDSMSVDQLEGLEAKGIVLINRK